VRKSVRAETTFERDLTKWEEVAPALDAVIAKVWSASMRGGQAPRKGEHRSPLGIGTYRPQGGFSLVHSSSGLCIALAISVPLKGKFVPEADMASPPIGKNVAGAAISANVTALGGGLRHAYT
jgi:hypothetical protein